MGQDPLRGCLSHTCTHLHPHAHVHITYTCASELALPLVPSLLSGPVEKPHLYDDIQHRIKAHVRPSSVYTATAKKGSIQPHTLMQSCTHSGWDTTPCAHTHTQLKRKGKAQTGLCACGLIHTQMPSCFVVLLLLQTYGDVSAYQLPCTCSACSSANTHASICFATILIAFISETRV